MSDMQLHLFMDVLDWKVLVHLTPEKVPIFTSCHRRPLPFMHKAAKIDLCFNVFYHDFLLSDPTNFYAVLRKIKLLQVGGDL